MSNDKDIELIESQAEEFKQREIDAITKAIPHGIGNEFCGCGNPVGEGRRNLGYSNCIDCSMAEEIKNKHFSRRF